MEVAAAQNPATSITIGSGLVDSRGNRRVAHVEAVDLKNSLHVDLFSFPPSISKDELDIIELKEK
jgi:hypothetical protein